MDSNLLGAIASNNGISDISAALDYRQARLDRDEAKRKEIRQNQLVGKALSSGLVEGSVMHEMASTVPQSYLAITKVMGIDPSDGAGVHQMTQDADIISAYGKAGDINGAVNYMQESKAQRDRLGLPTKHLTSGLQAIQEDAPKFLRATQMISDTFHPKASGAMNEKDREDIRLKEKELDWKMSQPEGGGLSPKDVVMTPSGAYVFDKRTGGFSKGLDESGNPIIGANYDSTLKRNLSLAGAEGAATGKDIADYKGKLFDSINNGNRTLNKYEIAIEQIDKGAESGPVMKMLPSLQDSTLLMDTIRKDIGMEIVGSGVLGVNPTDADVKLAMEVAIPEGLRPDALKKEIKRRAQVINDLNSAQREYYKMLDSGKTKGDILRMAEEKRATQKDKYADNVQNTNTGAQSLEAKKARLNELRESQKF